MKITINKNEWKALKLCLSKDKNKLALCNLNVEDNYLFTTDGRMLVRIAGYKLEDGSYKILLAEKEKNLVTIYLEKTELEAPSCKLIVPEFIKHFTHYVTDSKSISSLMFKILKKGTALDYELANKIIPDQYDVMVLDKKPVVLKGLNTLYLIMGFEFDENNN